MKCYNRTYYVCAIFMLLCMSMYAGDPPYPEKPPPNPELPIDGFVSLFVIFGAVYGAFELRRKK